MGGDEGEGHQSVGLVRNNAGEMRPRGRGGKGATRVRTAGQVGGWEEVEVYIREKTSGKPQRQSVSQTATTPTASRCPAISRRQPVKEQLPR